VDWQTEYTSAFPLTKTMICEVSQVQELRDGELILDQMRTPAAPHQHMKEGP
jgi:hypothetical protein